MSIQDLRESLAALCPKQSPIQINTKDLSINSRFSNTSGIALNQASCNKVRVMDSLFSKKTQKAQ